jgi:hypothetical protein
LKVAQQGHSAIGLRPVWPVYHVGMFFDEIQSLLKGGFQFSDAGGFSHINLHNDEGRWGPKPPFKLVPAYVRDVE